MLPSATLQPPKTAPTLVGYAIYVTVGGVQVTTTQTGLALDILKSSKGMMVRQPLQRAGNPLALCDYHAAAAPYRDRVALPMQGRGAAGRHLTKSAFILALEDVIASAAAGEPFSALLADTATAFALDASYSVSIARAAVGILEARHKTELRQRLMSASQAAVRQCDSAAGQFTCSLATACGTGACRFAAAGLGFIGTPASEGRATRPLNHRGGTFDPASALSELAEEFPLDLAAA